MANFYVRNVGSHANSQDGLTYDTAWLGDAAITWSGSGIGGGDTIYICGEFKELFTIQRGGTSDTDRLTFRGDAVEEAGKITGEIPLLPANWTDTAVNGEWVQAQPAGGWGAEAAKIITIGGVPINGAPNQTYHSVGSLPSGYWAYDVGDIYYRTADGNRPTDTLIIGTGVGGFSINGQDYITITNISLTHLWIGINDNSTLVTESLSINNCAFDNCVTHINAKNGDNLIIEDNTFIYGAGTGVKAVPGTGTCDNTIVRRNTFSRGLWSYNDANAEGHALDISEECSNSIVENNIFTEHCWYDGRAPETGAADGHMVLSVDGTVNPIVRRNTFSNNYRGCLQCGTSINGPSAMTGGEIYSNLFENNGPLSLGTYFFSSSILRVHMSWAETITMNIFICNNTFIGNRGSSIDNVWGIPATMVINSDLATITADGIFVYNNVFHENETKMDFSFQEVDGSSLSAVLKNNLFYRSAGGDYYQRYITLTQTNYPSTLTFSAWETAQGAVDTVDGEDALLDASYIPTNSSPCVGVGIKWWGTDPRPDTLGDPCPDTKIDIGGYQSTWDANHPKNL